MRNQYRVWDKENKDWCKEWVYLGQDGYLYQLEFDNDPSLLAPEWYRKEQFNRFYQEMIKHPESTEQKKDEEIKAKQHEWYTVEFATGYPDKNGTMLFEGDIISHEDIHRWPKTVHTSTAKRIARYPLEPLVIKWDEKLAGLDPFASLDEENSISYAPEKLKVIGTIHTTPDLLPKEEEKTRPTSPERSGGDKEQEPS